MRVCVVCRGGGGGGRGGKGMVCREELSISPVMVYSSVICTIKGYKVVT